MKKYAPLEDGWSEWVQPNMQGYRLGCCDCGLVHNVQFRIEGDKVQFRMSRNNRSTTALRNGMKRRSEPIKCPSTENSGSSLPWTMPSR